jgi:hypothetical protein
MSDGDVPEAWTEIDDIDVETARRLALARLNENQRHMSAHRPTARNNSAQFRGAAGELAARRWLLANGFVSEDGFETDLPTASDLTVGTTRIEVMTAQIAHREVTGFCVPPSKLKAATRRGAVGYLFVGTGPELEPRRFLMQGFCRLEDVGGVAAIHTRVSEHSPSVLNHVVPAGKMQPVDELIKLLRMARRR